jgi:protein-tyrosine phosphatase
VVVSLLEADEAAQPDLVDEAKATGANGIRFVSFPIPDRGVPASTAAAVSLIAAISAALESGQNVAVHCRQGLGRSGLKHFRPRATVCYSRAQYEPLV